MTITEQMIHLNSGQFWMLLIFLAGLSAACFYGAWRFFRRNRIIEDTPTARIRSAAQGYVELNGVAQLEQPQPLISPLTDTECCWYCYRIERKSDKNWRTVEKGSSETGFVIEDDTGRCLVLPKGAEVTASEQSVWYGASRQPQERNPPSSKVSHAIGGFRVTLDQDFSFKISDFSFTRYRYTEERIYPGDTLYALGYFRSLDEMDHQKSRSRITRDILRFWKKDQQRLLQRFDRNADGSIDTDEWLQVRQSAERIAAEKQSEEKRRQVPHSLSKPVDRAYPFLISSLPEFALARRYRIWSGVLLAGFFVFGVATVYLLSLHW